MKSALFTSTLALVLLFSSFTEKNKFVNLPLFGTKYAKTEIIDNSLNDQVFYLISGHGGNDPGATTKIGEIEISEDEYAYDVTLRLARNIISRGGKAYMINRDESDGIRDERILQIDNDETSWSNLAVPRKQNDRLKQRVQIINELALKNQDAESQFAVEIHVDSRHEDKNVDVFFYHQNGSLESQYLSDMMVDKFQSKYNKHQTGRGYTGISKARDLYTLRKTEVPTVYIELGNISNLKDQKRILDPNNRQAISNWLTETFIENK